MWKHVVKNEVIQERKWEFKVNDVVLGTIYHQARDSKYSLYVSSPFIYQEIPHGGKTHKFDALEEAQQAFNELCKEKALPWCREIVEYFRENDNEK